MAEFAHLHLHTEYSLLDGMGRTAGVRGAGQRTRHSPPGDHRPRRHVWRDGVVHALATSAGLHPIIGIEAYLAEGSARAKERKSYHLLLLAENEQGYRNLLKLSSMAAARGLLLSAPH